MKTCPREREVLDAIDSAEWHEELRQHSEKCSVCKDVARVALAFSEDYTAVLSDVRVPPAALVWWRSELKARQEAARKATRPITLVHTLALACFLGAAIALGRTLIPQSSGMIRQWVGNLAATVAGYTPGIGIDAALTAVQGPFGLVLALAVGCCLVLAPLTAYFILSDD